MIMRPLECTDDETLMYLETIDGKYQVLTAAKFLSFLAWNEQKMRAFTILNQKWKSEQKNGRKGFSGINYYDTVKPRFVTLM